MQVYYFYLHPTEHHVFVQKEKNEALEPEFVWIECTREDVVNRAEVWQTELFPHSHFCLNEFHVKDILNLEHPCVLDSLDDYDLLIFRKLITPDDEIKADDQAIEQHEKLFGYCLGIRRICPKKQKANSEELAYVLESIGRGGGIRTRDPLHPMQVRYQAALRPDKRAELYPKSARFIAAAFQ